jgi:hypothetical protein
VDALGFLRRDHDHLARTVAGILQQLADTNQAQTQALVAINAKTQRTGAQLSNLATGVTTVPVTWPNLWPDTAYGVYISVLPGQAAAGQVFAVLLNATKAVDGCTIAVNNTSGGVLTTVGIDVLGVRT